MKLYWLISFIALGSTGLMAGIFFTWTNAVTPGIGQLGDLNYLQALQAMNRSILNPLFYMAFAAPVISLLGQTVLAFKNSSGIELKFILAAAIIYIFGAFLVTLLGNIPLNEFLDQANLSSLSLRQIQEIRGKVEFSWNRFNLIRTISSFTAFVVLLYTIFLKIPLR